MLIQSNTGDKKMKLQIVLIFVIQLLWIVNAQFNQDIGNFNFRRTDKNLRDNLFNTERPEITCRCNSELLLMETSIKYKIDQQNLILTESNKQLNKLLELKSIKTIEIFESFDDRLKNIEKQLSTIHETMKTNFELLQEEKQQQETTFRYSNEDNTQNIILKEPTFEDNTDYTISVTTDNTLLEEDTFEDNTEYIYFPTKTTTTTTTTEPEVQKKNYEKEIINAIKNKDINKAVKLSKYSQKNLNIWIEILYDGNKTTTENILLFLNNLPDINDQILGYRILYNVIYINDHEYRSQTTSIAYQAVNVFNKTHSNNSDLISLLEDLPESLTKLPWNKWVNITNHALDVEIQSLGLYNQNNRFMVNAGKSQYHRDRYHSWKIQSDTNGTSFSILSFAFLRYLHEHTYNNDRTVAIITTVSDGIKNSNQWQLYQIPDSKYVIKNINSGYYLCIKNDLNLQMVRFDELESKLESPYGLIDYDSNTYKMCEWRIHLSYPPK